MKRNLLDLDEMSGGVQQAGVRLIQREGVGGGGRSEPPAFITATLITAPDFNLLTDSFSDGEAMADLLEAICPHGQKRTSHREESGEVS